MIFETCQKVSRIMKALGLDGPSEGSSFGTVSIAIKAVVTSASKHVDAKTGISLREWADFVSTARTRFDNYLGQLDKVAAIATRTNLQMLPSTPTTFGRTVGSSRMLSSRRNCGDQSEPAAAIEPPRRRDRRIQEGAAHRAGRREGWDGAAS